MSSSFLSSFLSCLLSLQFSLRSRAASNEDKREGQLVQSEMQMAKEDMS